MSTLGLHPHVRCHARTRPLPIVGHNYRNGAGQVRRLLSVVGLVAEFVVVKSGAGNCPKKRASSYPRGYEGTMLLDSFRTWLTAECDHHGRVIPTPCLHSPKARPNREAFREAMAEAIKGAA